MDNVLALFNLGKVYCEGIETIPNIKRGVELLEKGERLNDPYCTHYVGILHLEGKFGYPKNFKKGFSILEKSANLNHPTSLHMMGIIHLGMLGNTYNVEASIKFFEKAIELGDSLFIISLFIF